MNKFYAMDAAGASADVYIFGDVTSMPWLESDVAAHTFTTDLANLGAVSDITCHISSYGGEVEEGLAIFNALLAHPAHVTTICEGQACSIASVIFMAGDDRIMREASALFVHDCWTSAQGDADDLRKIADALDAQMLACKAAYMRGGIDADTLDAMLKADTWLTPEMAVEHGFATSIDTDVQDQPVAASAHKAVFDRIFAKAEPELAAEPTTELPAYADAFAELVAEHVGALSEQDAESAESESVETEELVEEPEPMTLAMRLAAAINQ